MISPYWQAAAAIRAVSNADVRAYWTERSELQTRLNAAKFGESAEKPSDVTTKLYALEDKHSKAAIAYHPMGTLGIMHPIMRDHRTNWKPIRLHESHSRSAIY